jgi:hypothetical protein
MSDISNQLIKDSYNYVLQSDLSTGIVYRIGGGIPVNPKFLSGLTINSNFNYSNGTEQPGYALITDGFGNATWGPVSGSSSGDYLPLSGGTVTGPTIFTGGLTANTISATTYFNLPSGLTCNNLSGCTIIQNIEQDIIDIQDNYVPYTGATKDLNLGYNTFINNNGLFTTWNNEFSEGEAKLGYDYQGAKQMYFRDVDKTNNFQYSAQTTEMLCNIEQGWGTSNYGFDFNDGTYFGSVINNTIGAAGFNTMMGDNNVSQVKTFAGEVALTNLTNDAGPLMQSSIRLLLDYTQLLITNNDTTEANTIELHTDRTYTKKYITTDEGYVGDYANLNTLTSTTISATTYQNLPVSGVTGGTGISAGTTNGLVTIVNTLPDQVVTITGGTNISVNGTYPNFGINFTGSTGISGDFLPLSGGTVTGATIFTSGLTANTLNVTGLTQTSGITSTGGITFKQVTINSSYTATTSDYMIDVTGGTFNVTLPSAVGIQGRLLVVKNNGGGAVTVQPVLGQNIDDKPFVVLGETNSIQLASNGSNWVAMSYNISTVNSSTGVFEFTGLSIASSTTFNVAPVKGWIVNDTTNPLSPQLYYVAYSGGVHTAIYVNTSTETWVYLTSGGTISQSSIELTEQQRRQNIFLGKLGHANKTNIINAFSQPDFVLSPLSQLRDMFTPINLINGGIYASANGANLSFNTSAGYLYGLGINFASSTLNPNTLYVSGASPCTFQYRTQTGGTASNTTFIDPTKYDVGGVVTPITGTKATNQRIYLVQNGIFRVQYGQTEYNQLSAAIEGIATEQFNTFSNFTNNGILIGILSVLSTATNLSDTSKARFFFTSKFGETVGSAGGVSTTTLQQAYNNSSTPEIVTNSAEGALSIKNGTGNADNVTNLFEGQNSGGNITSFIKADGKFSGSSISATTISATTYQNLPLTSLSGLSDVSITSVSSGDTLVYSGSSWVNKTLSEITGEYNVKITTPSSIVSGTTSETQVLKLEIPPYSFAANDVLNIPILIISKVGTGASYVLRVKLSELSTMPVGTGTQTIAFMSIGNTNIFTKLSRNFIINGGFLKGYPLSNNAADVANSTSSLREQAFDHTITNYLYVSVAPAFAGDTFQLIGLQINNL